MTEITVRPGAELDTPRKFADLITVRYDLLITAMTPIVHSQGVIGNDALLMTERVLDPTQPDAMPVDVPCLTGNSLRHTLREALARMTLRLLDVELHSLPLPAQHFLLSGGSLGKQAATLDVAEYRRIMEMFPYLGLFGGGLGSVLIPGKLQVGFGVLVCEQNAWRLRELAPGWDPGTPPPAEDLRERRQGTRHDIRRGSIARHMLPAGEQENYLERVTDEEAGKGDSTQMIYGYEAVAAGAQFLWQVGVQLATPLEHAALVCALVAMAAQGQVGAKSGTGHGRVAIRAIGETGEQRPLEEALRAVSADDTARAVAEQVAGGYVRHVQEHAGDIRSWLEGLK